MEAFLKRLSKFFGTGGLGWIKRNNICSKKIYNTEMICTRDFSSLMSENIPLKHKAFEHKQSRKRFLKHSLNINHPYKPSMKMSVCYLSFSKSYPFIEKYFLPSLPRHDESINLLRFVLRLKSLEKLPFLKVCRNKGLESLEYLESSKSLAPSYKYLKRFLSKRKFPELHKQYSSSCPTPYSSCPHSLSQDVFTSIRKTPKKLSKSQRNKTYKTSVHRGPCYPILLQKIHWRGFHSSLFPLAKSDSACKKDKICKSDKKKKTDENSRSCKEKNDVCRREKVKGDKRSQEKKQKPKTDPACKKICLPIGKCELHGTVSLLKMEYAKVTCPSLKLAKPKPCPPGLEDLQNDGKSHMETKQINRTAQKKEVCAPPPMPKPPFAPVVLCPCLPPRKVHPGPCPNYEVKVISKQPLTEPCPLKKKHPCPTGVYYCPPKKKPCNLKQDGRCERRKNKEASTS